MMKQVGLSTEASDSCSTMMAQPLKRKNTRWGPVDSSRTSEISNLRTAITAPMTSEQIDAYVMQVRIGEITEKLRCDDVVPADPDRRSASPPPRYDASGRRVNTRRRRYRERLEDELHSLVESAARTIPNYRAPRDYDYARCPRGRRRLLISDRIYVPARDFPEVNFIGQLLGPRGRSIADMNARSGATIVIRGKGSVKEGRSGKGSKAQRSTARPNTNDRDVEDEGPLHCLITADAQEKVDRAKALIQAVIETAVTTPDHGNERKRQQLRDVAVLNGTFRGDEGSGGVVGGDAVEGRLTAPPVICRLCNNSGHIARDCTDRKGKVVPWRNPTGQHTDGAQGPGDAVDIACSQFLSELR